MRPAPVPPLREPGKRGRLVYVVGPSGAGKDTILRHLEATLTPDAGVVIARRFITRPADPDGERHAPLSRAAFERLRSAGAFCMSWENHGLGYGIGRDVTACLDGGLTVLVNGSRAHLPEARRDFASGLEAVLVTASPDVLAARLAARRRETRAAIAARLERGTRLAGTVRSDLVIRNDGSIDAAVAALRDFLLGQPACA